MCSLVQLSHSSCDACVITRPASRWGNQGVGGLTNQSSAMWTLEQGEGPGSSASVGNPRALQICVHVLINLNPPSWVLIMCPIEMCLQMVPSWPSMQCLCMSSPSWVPVQGVGFLPWCFVQSQINKEAGLSQQSR